MSYQALARKWRPRTFKDMIGQEEVIRILENALMQKRIHHAYLFSGTRGIGKTTFGRILAKCLNCESDITSAPCNQCTPCKNIDAGQFLDLYEVDAASRTKVEDTRDLLENVLYPPSQGRYKIYLIDEVHMLSNHSFNALLKTLEEPPSHVKFLLATTDPKKLPVTILSRCLQFHLKRISKDKIANHLAYICQAENIAFEMPALHRLALAADGSLRDALSLLDQAIAYGSGTILPNDVELMLGSVAAEDILPLIQALATQNNKQLFEVLQQLNERAPDFQYVLEALISLFHQIAIVQIVPETPASEGVLDLARQLKPEDVQIYYQIALLGRRDLGLSPNPQQGFEMVILRMFAFQPLLSKSVHPIDQPKPVIEKKTPIASIDKGNDKSSIAWRELLQKLELSGMAYALASNCTLLSIHDNAVKLGLSVNHQPMLNDKLKERLQDALSRHFKQPVQLEINITSENILTPVKQSEQEQKDRLTQAKEKILTDPNIKKLIEIYDATLEVSLLS